MEKGEGAAAPAMTRSGKAARVSLIMPEVKAPRLRSGRKGRDTPEVDVMGQTQEDDVDFKVHGAGNIARTYYPEGHHPKEVEYEGVCHAIKAAKKMCVNRVVLLSSMGMSDPGHWKNAIKTHTGERGNVLQWKLKAEDFVRRSGMCVE